jgi:hypothetical protein
MIRTITAWEIADKLPMRAVILDKTNHLYSQEILFFKATPMKNIGYMKPDWFLIGKARDGSSYFCTDNKDEMFGVME